MRSNKPAQTEQKRPECRHQWPRASTLYNSFIFICFLAVSSKSFKIFLAEADQYMGRSGPVWKLVPSYRSPHPWTHLRVQQQVLVSLAIRRSPTYQNISDSDSEPRKKLSQSSSSTQTPASETQRWDWHATMLNSTSNLEHISCTQDHVGNNDLHAASAPLWARHRNFGLSSAARWHMGTQRSYSVVSHARIIRTIPSTVHIWTMNRVATVLRKLKSSTFKHPHNFFPDLFHHSFQQMTASQHQVSK